MSVQLLNLVRSFLREQSDPVAFVDNYVRMWKEERDTGQTAPDSPQLSEALSSIFCLADLFNADADRESYELDESQLQHQIAAVLRNVNGNGFGASE